MPFIHVFACAERMHAARQAELGPAIAAAFADWFGTDAASVRCNITPSTILAGAPAYVEVRYRATDPRDAAAHAGFLQALDTAVRATFGCTPHIQCLPLDPVHIWARH